MKKRFLVPAMAVAVFVLGVYLATQIYRNARVIDTDALVAVYESADSTSPSNAYLAPGVVVTVDGRSSNNLWYHIMSQSGLQGWVESKYIDLSVELLMIPVTFQNGEPSDIKHPLPEPIVQNIRNIYRAGQQQGRRADVFAKIGDSITVSQNFFHPIGSGVYDLGEYTYLRDVIAYYGNSPVRTGNSFTTRSVAAEVGWTTAGVLNRSNADPSQCIAGETPIACELRVTGASIALIMLGTNDTVNLDLATYQANLERIVSETIDASVIPVLSTIPPRVGHEARIAQFNAAIREVADRYLIPLWDYGATMSQLPRYGLTTDNIHPSSPPAWYDDAANFNPQFLQYGYVLRNLTGLQMLDSVWRYVRS